MHEKDQTHVHICGNFVFRLVPLWSRVVSFVTILSVFDLNKLQLCHPQTELRAQGIGL